MDNAQYWDLSSVWGPHGIWGDCSSHALPRSTGQTYDTVTEGTRDRVGSLARPDALAPCVLGATWLLSPRPESASLGDL